MQIGVYASCTDETLRPDEVAVLVEQAGIDALHFGEHSHIPASEAFPPDGQELPRDWARLFDLLIALTAAALATTRLRVSSGIIQVAQRDPITTAKELSSIDVLSGGRLDLIVGHGTIIEEMRNHGVDPETRFDLVRERMLAMREIWGKDEASFHGAFVNFERILSWPKPVQPGGVPLFFGGNSPGSEERAREYGDGWAPLALPGIPARIREFTAEGSGLPVIAVGVPTEPAAIDEYASAGADRIVFRLTSAQPGEVERSLEDIRRCMSTVAG
ncbi:TIGR03619 family F420-dependent LLM class oxidoreductase [Geodermatophilus sp. CPCC 205506]|uniref:TIGR03619 family F420-dependent LLM class oxidoreductase n=1 Tax=Geodermatophilus sp. CPCC 205506 TaxID=2936596 RepID=UPI003EEE5D42